MPHRIDQLEAELAQIYAIRSRVFELLQEIERLTELLAEARKEIERLKAIISSNDDGR